jgi:hypothetical protein
MWLSRGPVVLILGAVLISAQSVADAAALKGAVAACKDQADIKKALVRASDKETKATAAYIKSKTASGDCLQLTRGAQVDVDQRDGVLWCVRPAGALDCYWTLDKAVDLYPANSATSGQSQSGGGGRKGRH